MRLVGVFTVILILGEIEISLQAPIRTKENASKQEAIKIALESSNELLPRPKMVEKIKSDLELIRYLDPNLSSRIHEGRWKPGQLYIKEISKEQLDELQESEFGPIKSISESTKEPGTIHVVFAKPYNPDHLSKLLRLRFGFDSYPVPPNERREQKMPDKIAYNHQLSTYYFNPVNGYNCKKGCLTQYAVSIFVDENSDDDDDFLREDWENNAL